MRSKLTAKRKELKLTQEKIAHMLGVTRACYANYEQGTRNISFAKVVKLKKILDTQDDEIFLDDISIDDTKKLKSCTA